MSKKNPILDLPVWTREAMAVAQDWELERGNEGALIWTDLGPEMARVVCKNQEMLAVLSGVANRAQVRARAGAWAGARAEVGAWAWARVGTRTWAGARAEMWAWVRVRAGGRNDYA
jgi:hypothetical protein